MFIPPKMCYTLNKTYTRGDIGFNQTVRILEEVKKAVCGKDRVLVWVLTVLLARGHVLLEDIPGVGKTTMALAFSRALGLDYGRVQFTPDVLPSDITGYSVYQKETGRLIYQPGAVLCNLFLADELNRATSRTQSALLEAMEERHVSVDGKTYPLPTPFVVLATQNPTGSAGTTMLPNSQLDRFLIKISMGYPDLKSQISILQDRHTTDPLTKAQPVINNEQLQELIAQTTAVHVAEPIYAYIANLAQATREHAAVQLGVSPRGALAVCRMAKAYAFVNGRDYVVPEDVAAIFPDVAAHRLMLNAKARMMELDAGQITQEILKQVAMPTVKTGGK